MATVIACIALGGAVCALVAIVLGIAATVRYFASRIARHRRRARVRRHVRSVVRSLRSV